MSREAYEVLPGALLISDAHYTPTRRPQLLELFRAIDRGAVTPPQLLLMGDMFDLLFGQIRATHVINAIALDVLRRICRRIPVLYLEGNHDFNLRRLIPDATVVPLCEQPLPCFCGPFSLLLAHGDFNQPLKYRLYTSLIRHPAVLRLLGWVNRVRNNAIIDKLEAYLALKNDCHVIEGFETRVQAHLAGIDLGATDVFIEGHYHQGVSYELPGVRYINPAAFACNRVYGIVKIDTSGFQIVQHTWHGKGDGGHTD